jgi:hypothetical protein
MVDAFRIHHFIFIEHHQKSVNYFWGNMKDANKPIETVSCVDLRESRFNLPHEGIYKFGNLFKLYLTEYLHLHK